MEAHGRSLETAMSAMSHHQRAQAILARQVRSRSRATLRVSAFAVAVAVMGMLQVLPAGAYDTTRLIQPGIGIGREAAHVRRDLVTKAAEERGGQE
jgi:hypothetical protein